MSQPKTRRFVAALSVSATLLLFPLTEAQAAQRRQAGDSSFVSRVESRAAALWTAVTGIWSKVGVRIDGNGFVTGLWQKVGVRIDDNG